jgi:hypothetical protein
VTCSPAAAACDNATASASSKSLDYAKAVCCADYVFIHADHATEHILPSSTSTKKSYISSETGIIIDTVVTISKY